MKDKDIEVIEALKKARSIINNAIDQIESNQPEDDYACKHGNYLKECTLCKETYSILDNDE